MKAKVAKHGHGRAKMARKCKYTCTTLAYHGISVRIQNTVKWPSTLLYFSCMLTIDLTVLSTLPTTYMDRLVYTKNNQKLNKQFCLNALHMYL